MKAEHIILHLMENVPKYTSSFSDYITPDSMTMSGAVVTVNKTAHGLTTNDIVTVTNGSFLNPITNIDDSGDDVVFTTTEKHDMTPGFYTQAYLQSATDPGIDDWYNLTDITDGTHFSIATFPDTGLTDVIFKMFREIGINGLFQVTVIDVDQFTYTLPADTLVTLDISPDAQIHTQIRISGASTIERCIDAYEEQKINDLWGFVILQDNIISKDKYANTDADLEQGGLNQWNGKYLSPFSFYVFVRVDEITGRKARDTIETERPPIFNALLGASFETGFQQEDTSVVTPRGDSAHGYKKAYYIHEFEFVQIAQISNEDIIYNKPTTAWQNLEFDYLNIFNNNGDSDVSTALNIDEK